MKPRTTFALAALHGLLLSSAAAIPASAGELPVTCTTTDCSGLTFSIDDKDFTVTDCVAGGEGGGSGASCIGLTFTPETQDGGVDGTLYGFKITDDFFVTFGSSTWTINYTVDVTDPNKAISDAHLFIGGEGGGVCGPDCFDANVTEYLGSEGSLYADVKGPTSDSTDFTTPTQSLAFSTVIFLEAAGYAYIYSIDVLFSQTCVNDCDHEAPEPASAALFGGGLLGMALAWLRRRRKKSA